MLKGTWLTYSSLLQVVVACSLAFHGASLAEGNPLQSRELNSGALSRDGHPILKMQFHPVGIPEPGEKTVLQAVASVDGLKLFAAGSYFHKGVHPLVERLAGNKFDVMPIKMPTNPSFWASFFGISADREGDAWAVGSYQPGWTSGVWKVLIMHYDGRQFKFIPAPSPGKAAALFSVVAINPDNAWAVGGYFQHGVGYMTLQFESTNHLLIEHWNGSNWKVVNVSNPGHGQWNGGTNVLAFVSASSPSDVWAVGHYFNDLVSRNLCLRFDGLSWKEVKTPNIGNGINALFGVAATGKKNIWTVGTYTRRRLRKSLVLHFNGLKWAKVITVDIPHMNNLLFGINGDLRRGVWAVGTYFNRNHTGGGPLIERLMGRRFESMPVRKVGSSDYRDVLYEMTTCQQNYFAVGEFYNKVAHRAMIERSSLKRGSPNQY